MTTETPALTRRGKHRTGAGARWNPDAIGVYRTVNAGVIVVALAAVVVSWQGLTAVAAWMLIPAELAWIVPIMLDVTIMVFTLGVLPRRARGESVWLLAIGAYALTAISATANFTHVILQSPEETDPLQRYAGAALAGLAPMLILLSTEVLGTLITRPPREQSPGRRAKRQAQRIKELESAQRKQAKELKAAVEREEAAVSQLAAAKRALDVLKPPTLLSPETLNEVESALGTLPAPYATMSPAASYTGDIAHADSTTTGGNA